MDEEPDWLDDREQRAWRQLAAVVLKLPTELERQLQRDAGLSHVEYWVLALLSEAPEHAIQLKHLAARANASQSRLSHVVRRLEERGLVRRRPARDDARASDAVLTDAGLDVVVASAPGHVATVRSLVFEPLAAADVDVAELARVCGAIAARLEH